MQQSKLYYYDSYNEDGKHYMKHVFQYIQDEYERKNNSPLPDKRKWTGANKLSPKQTNGT